MLLRLMTCTSVAVGPSTTLGGMLLRLMIFTSVVRGPPATGVVSSILVGSWPDTVLWEALASRRKLLILEWRIGLSIKPVVVGEMIGDKAISCFSAPKPTVVDVV